MNGIIDPTIRKKVFGWSLVTTPLFVIIGIISTGAGHGDYVIARILFPYTFAYWYFSSDAIPWPLGVLGLLQIPIYGGLLALPLNKKIIVLVAIIMIILHLFAVYLCFSDNYNCL